MNLSFDVQGTPISGGIPRPHSRQVIRRLVEMGHHVYLWSGGGSTTRPGSSEDLVFGCFGKAGTSSVSVDFVVADQPGMAERYGGYTVLSFSGDRELLGALLVVETPWPH